MTLFKQLESFDETFKNAFKHYFSDLGISNIKDEEWLSIFNSMESSTEDIIYIYQKGNEIQGFIIFRIDAMTNWFFTEPIGFIREFWVHTDERLKGIGKTLLNIAEDHFVSHSIKTVLLTTDSTPKFYEKHGYNLTLTHTAKNNDEVYIKHL